MTKELRDYQIADLAFYMTKPRVMNLSDPGCQPAGSKVLMEDGTWSNVEDIRIGDRLVSPQEDGSVSVETVIATEAHDDQKIMRVSSKVGSYLCSWNHVLPHRTSKLRDGRRIYYTDNLSCDEILKRSPTYQGKAKLFTTPAVQFPKKELPLDPYFLGVYLGDGTSNGSVSVSVNLKDLKILERIQAGGVEPGKQWEERGCIGVRFLGQASVLKSLGLYSVKSPQRFVPLMYKSASLQQRLDLLAGLWDSDGGSDGSFSTTSSMLAEDIVDLVRSVGGMAVSKARTTSFQGKICHSFRVHCSFAEHQPFGVVLRKIPGVRDMEWKSPRNHRMTIEEAGVDRVYGFTMTGKSQWYVTDNWIVTHNTGKTPSVAVWAYFLWAEKKCRSVWAMPKSLLKKNVDELLEFTELRPEDVIIVDGTPAQRDKQMQSDAKVFLMGFDCFSNNWEKLLEYHPDVNALLIDEFHMGYGGPNSKRTQNMYLAMERIEYFLPMTGTIINGRLSSVYPCIHVIAPHLYPHGYEGFKVAHAIEDSYGRVVAWTNTARITKFLRTYGIRHSFEEIYGKEAKVILHEKCEMEPAQREAYDEFAEAALLELENSWLDGSLPGVNFIRCRQLMEHPQDFGPPLDKIKLTGKEERLLIHLEHVKATGQPLVVFASLNPSQDRIVKICQDMGLRVGLINGTVSQKKRVEIDEAFRNGDLDVIVGSPATAAVGFNWGHVDKIIFMSLDYLDSSFRQGYRRAIRGVRDSNLLIYILEYEDSVDQRIFDIVDTKSKLATDVDATTERLDLRNTGKKRLHIKADGAKFRMADLLG